MLVLASFDAFIYSIVLEVLYGNLEVLRSKSLFEIATADLHDLIYYLTGIRSEPWKYGAYTYVLGFLHVVLVSFGNLTWVMGFGLVCLWGLLFQKLLRLFFAQMNVTADAAVGHVGDVVEVKSIGTIKAP
jgi:hypothetical protein